MTIYLFFATLFQNVSKKMPSTSRPRVTGGSGAMGRLSANTPMSERQQMALLMQMTSASNQAGIHFIVPIVILNIHTRTHTKLNSKTCNHFE